MAAMLNEQIVKLGWPVSETFGMTETSSMVALKKNDLFELLRKLKRDHDGRSDGRR